MASFDQSSFAGGQVSRKYFGQEKEGQEDRLAMAKNVIVDSEGSVEKRPGTQVILKDNNPWSVSGDKRVKLVPFRYSNSDQYVLILKDYKMDIYKDNRIIGTNVATPWSEDDLNFDPANDEQPGLKYYQDGRWLVFTHPNYLPRQLNRYSDDDFRFEFVNEYQRTTSGKNLTVRVHGGTSGDPEQNFRFMALGVGEDDKWLGEITAQEVGIRNVTFFDGEAIIELQTDADFVRVGDRVILKELGGSTELNNRSFTVSTVEARRDQDYRIYRSTSWHTASTLQDAKDAARATLTAAGFTNDITFVENTEGINEGEKRSESRTVNTVFQYSASTQAGVSTSVTLAQIRSAINAANLARTGEVLTEPNAAIDISSFPVKLINGGGRRVVYKAGQTGTDAGTPDERIRINDYTSDGTNYYARIFTVRLRFTRSVSTGTVERGTFVVRARGWKLTEGVPARVSRRITIDTELNSLSAHTRDTGKILTTTIGARGFRDAEYKLEWEDVASDVERIAVFQDSGQGFGLAGATLGPETTLTITNIEENPLISPPVFRDPFRNQNPQCSGLFQQRRVYGGFGDLKPNTLKFSRSGFKRSFLQASPITNADAFDKVLDSEEVNEIRHLVRLKATLFAHTGGGLWRIYSQGPFTTRSALTSKEQTYGASNLIPLTIGDTMLHVGETGDIVYATGLNASTDRHVTEKVSQGFHDILQDKHVLDWDYVEGRNTLVLAVLSDGSVACLSYDTLTSTAAVSTWELGNDMLFRGVSVVNSRRDMTDDIDPSAVFLVQEPDGGKKFLWRMEFAYNSLTRRFLADGITSHNAANSVANEDGGWAYQYRSDPEVPSYFDLKRRHVFDNGNRVDFHKGHFYNSFIQTIPNWAAYPHNYKQLMLRLEAGSEVYVKGDPRGERNTVKKRYTNDAIGLRGGYIGEIMPGRLDYAYGPQAIVGQEHPSPFVLLGVTCYASGENE